MAIIAKNIKVGGDQAPTKSIEVQIVQNLSEIKRVVESTNKTETPSKYIKKKEGDLVRHINTKSSYQKDMLDL